MSVALQHFYLTTYQATRIFGGFQIVTTTDVPCHMWLRRTTIKPQVHIIPRIRRGTAIFDDKRYCFVSYDDLEQEEDGDTSTHTFIFTPLDFCTWQYFYLWATNTGIPMLSTSPIFHLHYPPGLPPYETDERCKDPNNNTGFCQYWNANSQTFTPDHDFRLHHLSLMLNQWEITRRGPYLVKITEVGGPCWSERTLDSQQGYSTSLPAPGFKEWVDFPLITPRLQKNKPYRIVVYTIPGWEWFIDGAWAPWEPSAAIQWWAQINPGPYPRGERWYGCNIRDGSGVWVETPNHDLTFILWDMCK